MLQIDSRPGKLGVSLATPTQKHGEERVPAKSVRVKNVLLTKAEVISLAEHIGVPDAKHAWDMLFNERKGKPAEPFWAGKLTHTIPGRFKDCSGEISFGIAPYVVSFGGATVSRLTFDEQIGGMVAVSFMLMALKSNIRGDLAKLDEYLGADVNVALELGDPGEDEDEDEKDADQESLDLTPGGDTASDKSSRKRKPSDGATVN